MLPQHIAHGHPDYLLFDDLVHVPDAIEEHKAQYLASGCSGVLHKPYRKQELYETILAQVRKPTETT